MAVVSACPRASQWLHLVRGESPAEEQKDLVSHLLECRDCAGSLKHFPVSDSLLSEIQARAVSREFTLTPDLEELLRLHQKTSPLRTPMIGDADHATLGEERSDPAERQWASLLKPATGPGELGWLGQYRVLRILGTGGMGRVFLAEDTHLKRPVALKVMSPHLVHVPAARERFLREARSAAGIRDDHIVTIYQVGQVDDVPFLAMELLEGESLDAYLHREGKLGAAQVARIGREIAEGLAVAHAQGLIHRDIKPANLWLERSGTPDSQKGSFKRVKILDFGLARAAEGPTSLTATGQVLGTPHYMSPEQARGAPVDARSDLFSLGCVLYRLAAGREPFEGETVMAVLTALAVQEPRPLHDFQPDLPEDLVKLVHRLLRKNADERLASAREAADALRVFEDTSSAPPVKGVTPSSPAPESTEIQQPLLNQTDNHVTGGSSARVTPPSQNPAFGLPRSRRFQIYLLACLAGILVLGLAAFLLHPQDEEPHPDNNPHSSIPPAFTGPPIRVGILHSITGTMAESGTAVADATILAIEEINQKGGVMGRKIEYVLRDGQSDPDDFALEAEHLLSGEKVSALFGCWTSAERKQVRPIIEKHRNLLLYPLQYEGLEISPNIVYLGMTPNQQILPAVQYCFATLHKRRFFLVGSDYVFPHAANEMIKDELKALGATVAGEAYVPLGEPNVHSLVEQIVAAKPDVILNTINGDTNRRFFRQLRKAGITPDKVPTVSFSISEPELKKEMVGDYAAWCYFMSLPDAANQEFVKKVRDRFGPERVTSDPMLSAYASVHLWARAVEKAGTDDPVKVRAALANAVFHGPGGELRIDPETFHTWQAFRLGRIVEGPTFELVSGSEVLIRPEPFLNTRSREQWECFLQNLFQTWGNRWDNSGE